MFLPDEQTMKYVTSLTADPSDINVRAVEIAVKKHLDEKDVPAQLELIAMAVEPVHPGIKDRLAHAL